MSLVGNVRPKLCQEIHDDTIEKLDMRGAFRPRRDITSVEVALLARGKFDPYTALLRYKQLVYEASQRSQDASQAQESQQVDIKEEGEPEDEPWG
ncbi:hypothetical protein K469DRAFT_177104 [Zopfia rhizophila CBS 207.26]|uniref:Uncharacterized protein n=1 Tax=Zopfia rhizophila CBS 207.26 TaxID=1314779 RepID=A0A6A6E3B9_9PEZI|nr:hypothetical protein K469DRAFT_177104 [Zopfia rhizophila CBS 207.26]